MSEMHYTIQKLVPRRSGGEAPPVSPIGDFAQVMQVFSRLNTGPDAPGGTQLFGPGYRVECEFSGTDVIGLNLFVSESEQELFNLLLEGPLAAAILRNGWQLCNTATGQTFPRRRDEEEDLDQEETSAG